MKALINFKLTIKDTELVPQSWLHRTRVETQAFRFQASPLLKEQGHLFSAHSVHWGTLAPCSSVHWAWDSREREVSFDLAVRLHLVAVDFIAHSLHQVVLSMATSSSILPLKIC